MAYICEPKKLFFVRQMELKEKLVSKFKELLKKENLEEYRTEIENVIVEFRDLVKSDKAEKLEAFVADGDKPEFFEMPVDEYDRAFEQLNDRYVAVLKEKKDQKRRQEEKNFEIKQELIKELTDLIENEDVIAQAFKTFNSIQERWESVGNVPSHLFKDLQNSFRKKVEEFYYHINIYKELKINDLKKNLEKKEDLIKRMEKLREETDIKEIEILHKAYMMEWDQIGPTFKENWEEIKARFYDLSHQLSDKVKSHYKGIRDQQKVNLQQKQELVQKLMDLSEEKISSAGDWNKATDQVKKWQEEWKKIGYATKNQNQKVWEEFREAGNKFFELKSQFFKQIRGEHQKIRDQKKELIDLAAELLDIDMNDESFDWKKRTNEIISLQKRWKSAGSASRFDEQKLWKKFRSYCDDFFSKKDEFFNGKEDRLKDNLVKKEALIHKVQDWKAGGDKQKDLDILALFTQEWNSIGFVPSAKKEKIAKDFAKAIDAAYGQLNVGKKEKLELAFAGKIKQLSDSADPIKSMEIERRKLNDKKQKLQGEIRQLENNLSFFSNANSDNPLLKESKDKISRTEGFIEEIDHKIKLLNIELNKFKKAQQEEVETKEEE